jgi:hypothetical protein
VREYLPHALSLSLGVVYGVFARIAFATHAGSRDWFGVMSASFLFGVPFIIGVVFALRYPFDFPLRWTRAVGGAIACSLLALGATMLLALEGLICVVVVAPVFIVMAGLGGLVGWGIHAVMERRRGGSRGVMLSVAGLLPFLLSPIEHAAAPPVSVREVHNEIRIHASPDVVWQNIASVRAIRRDELPFAFSHVMGLPRPIEATLSHEGVGGVRVATFERGLSFHEAVSVWEPGRRLAFSIRPESVPSVALDEHVAVGGPYFDVLEGTYTLDVVGPHEVVLHLSSRQRLSTRFNRYASLWSDFVMYDLQRAILDVIRRRCEVATR